MKRYALLASVGVLAACVHTNAALVNPTVKYQSICPDAVLLFSTPDKVGREYTEVAILNSSGNTEFTSEKGMYNSQRKKAAQLGANAIVLSDIKEPGAGAKIAGAVFGVGAERKGKAMAIYIPADTQRVREACAAKKS